jgi:hypothetical protein
MEHDGLLNSSEINFVIDGNNYSSQPEERVWCFFLAFEVYATPFYFFSSHLEEISYSPLFLWASKWSLDLMWLSYSNSNLTICG